MTEQTWIYVPEGREEEDEAPDWTGLIWSEGDRMLRWQFEVIRLARGIAVHDQGVFQDARPVAVLIDHQRWATLLRPLVSKVDPGKSGTKNPFLRTKLSGSFEALLVGKAVLDEHEALFYGMGVESETFAAWYGGIAFREKIDDAYRPTSIEMEKTTEETVRIAGLGEAVAVRTPFVQRGHASSEVRTRTVLRITFDEPKSLNALLDLARSVELLFGFLAGFRPKLPTFHLWWKADDPKDGGLPRDADLELGGVQFRAGPTPHPVERLHMNGRDAAGLQEVLQVLADARFDLPTRIAAVQTGRWFGATVNDRFAAVMPVLEECLKARFPTKDETSYVASEKDFFAHVDASIDPDVREFSRKHVVVKDRKAPSLTTLVGRAMVYLNDGGFAFAAELAKRIADRRAAMFHSSPTFDDVAVQRFHEETTAATAILMLLTLDDLGVDLQPLSSHFHALGDISPFMRPPSSI